jgi:hydroxymethylbilane synthase
MAFAEMGITTYATRRSPLALAQSRAFAALVSALRPSPFGGTQTRELQVVTSGDRQVDRPLTEIGGKGLFVKEIEEALLDGRADFAVHSLKDVPAELPTGLILTCIPAREDPRDALVAPRHGTIAALPKGARVGTSSLRRAASLHAMRSDLGPQLLRGNVDTRLRKVDAGEYDAIILARSGLLRLGLQGRVTEILTADAFLPAPGQGALGIECRVDDARTRALLAGLHDATSAACVAAERGVLQAVGGDCRTPLGAYAERINRGEEMRLRAFVAEADGSRFRRAERVMRWPEDQTEARDAGLALGKTLL